MAVVRPLILNLTVQKYCFYFIYANFSALFLHFLKILHTFRNFSMQIRLSQNVKERLFVLRIRAKPITLIQ